MLDKELLTLRLKKQEDRGYINQNLSHHMDLPH